MKHFLLLSLLIPAAAFANKPCGLQGSTEERIKDCSVTKGNFALVTLTEKGSEFYKDLKTGLIWGSRITIDFNHYGSQKACDGEVSGYDLKLKWRLPSIREFEQASAHGMKEALSNTTHSYWSSTPVKMERKRRRNAPPAQNYIWDGFEQRTDVGDLKDGASVRCVAKD